MNFRTAIRQAIVATLTSDPTLESLFGGPVSIVYRPARQRLALPRITFFDYGTSADTIVPLFDRMYQIDIFTNSDLDQAEALAEQIEVLLDTPRRIAQGLEPTLHANLPPDVANVVYFSLISDNDLSEENADLVRKTLHFRALAYNLI